MATKLSSLHRIWILLALVILFWTTFTFLRPWISYIRAMQDGVSSITYRLEGSYVVTSFNHTRIAQTEIVLADYTGNTPVIKKWSSAELYVLIGIGIIASILVIFFSIGLSQHYSKRNVIAFAASSIVWYITMAVGKREVWPLLAIGWLLCAALTVLFTFFVYKRASASATPK